MTHPDNGMLLAYVRRQQGGALAKKIQQHIAQCQLCRLRCTEFAQVGTTIETWTRSSSYRSYPSLTNSVLRQIYESKQSVPQHLKHNLAPTSIRVVSIPVAMLLVVLCMVTVTIIVLANLSGRTASPNIAKSTQTTIPVLTTGIPPKPTATLPPPTTQPTTVSIIPGSPTATTTAEKPRITNCTTTIDVLEQHLHICGRNFTPGRSVVLILNTAGGKVRQHEPVKVSADGTIQDSITVHSCKDVPAAIQAQSTTATTEVSQVLNNIAYGNCQILGTP